MSHRGPIRLHSGTRTYAHPSRTSNPLLSHRPPQECSPYLARYFPCTLTSGMQVGTHRDTKASFSIIRMVAAPGTLGLVLLSGLGLGGCQASGPFAGPTFALDNAQFMATWKTYLHCRSSADPAEIRADLLQLTHVARMASGRNRASFLLLPASLRSFLALPPSRLAVDPHAMAVTCALHGSDVAKATGQTDLSRELLTTIVRTSVDTAPR